MIAFSIGAVLTEFCGVLARALGATRRYDGPIGKSDRAFVVGALALATYFYPRALGVWPVFFWIAAALTAVTCGEPAGAGAEGVVLQCCGAAVVTRRQHRSTATKNIRSD